MGPVDGGLARKRAVVVDHDVRSIPEGTRSKEEIVISPQVIEYMGGDSMTPEVYAV